MLQIKVVWKYVRFSMYASVKSCERIDWVSWQSCTFKKSWTVLLGGWIVFTARMSVVNCEPTHGKRLASYLSNDAIKFSKYPDLQISYLEKSPIKKITKRGKKHCDPLILSFYISNRMDNEPYQPLHIFITCFFCILSAPMGGRKGGQTL